MDKKKTERKRKLSWVSKSDGMSLKEWQIALRKQIAEEESYDISRVGGNMHKGEYSVTNPKTRSEYKVVYRGVESRWNYCSCMDFKTAQLGTCKHLEAVKMWTENHPGLRVHPGVPSYTSVYLSYVNGRKVCIRVGSDHRAEFAQLAARYFDHDGVLPEHSYENVDQFIQEAVAISPNFRFYQDALDFIVEKREEKLRRQILNRYSDGMLDQLLSVALYPYQKDGIRFAFTRGRSIIADEMGLGKTVQAIGTAELLQKENLARSVLVICPTSLKYQWQREIERFTGKPARVIEGPHHKRIKQYKTDEPYKIVSYNSACNDIKILGKLETDLIIMDEVQRLKNWNTQISKAMRRVVSSYAVILSGTPLENKLEELYSVMEFADNFCFGPFWKFKAECIVSDETGKVLGYKNLNKVGEKARQRLLRRTKKQVALQMPERQDKILLVPMTKEQREQHDELKSFVSQIVTKWKRFHFLSEKDRNRLLLCLSQMRMLCDSTYILDQRSRHDTKVDEAMNIITSLLDIKGEKVVVFSQWERMTRLIAQELDNHGIGFEYLHGGVPSSHRGKLISHFADNPDSRVFLSTDAGATGLNLQSAATVINLDLPWNPAVLEQRIARVHRLGQHRNVQVINLVSASTIEERMLDKLKFKSALFEGVLDYGQDMIFLNDESKISQIIDSLDDLVEESEAGAENADTGLFDESPAETSIAEGIASSVAPAEEREQPLAPPDLIAQGVTFLNGLAATLKSPEATRQLVESLVETDVETGKSILKIPVPDKQAVHQFLDIVGKLFG